MLGVWLRDELDADLPRMSCRDLVSWKAEPIVGAKPRLMPASIESSLCIGESFSLLGMGALCWLYGPLVHGANTPLELTHAVVQGLIRPYSRKDHAFAPVFPEGEAPSDIQAADLELRERVPNLIARTWFIDDWNKGLIERAPG